MSTLDESAPPAWCRDQDTPVSPFEALRVAYGMLLGEDDFRVLQGNPRGKQMLHSAWLHGSAVVWGFGVGTESGGRRLQVGPGLAIDGVGRELYLGAPRCLDIDAWLAARQSTSAGDHGEAGRCAPAPSSQITAALVAVFHPCPTRPVPSLADPCDVQRMHTDCSRIVESVHLELREQTKLPTVPVPGPYHGVRVLLGLERAGGTDDRIGWRAVRKLEEIGKRPATEQPPALVNAFREIAALDVTELRPAAEDKTVGIFPAEEGASEVLLARVTITPSDESATWKADVTARRSLLATSTIQELACALAPGLLLTAPGTQLGGPRVKRSTIRWVDQSTLTFDLSKPANPHTLTRGQVSVSSLGNDGGWLLEDIRVNGVQYQGQHGRYTVHIRLHQPPRHHLVRLIVRGTGPIPVTGVDAVPLAGCDDGPSGTAHDGHDAVHQLRKGLADYPAPGTEDTAAYPERESKDGS